MKNDEEGTTVQPQKGFVEFYQLICGICGEGYITSSWNVWRAICPECEAIGREEQLQSQHKGGGDE